MSTANIAAKDVMALRQKTGLGMMDCKKALIETDGDMDAAEAALRAKLKGKMDERTDRAAGEGCIAIQIGDNGAAIIEIRAETDFTARNEAFGEMMDTVVAAALTAPAAAHTQCSVHALGGLVLCVCLCEPHSHPAHPSGLPRRNLRLSSGRSLGGTSGEDWQA